MFLTFKTSASDEINKRNMQVLTKFTSKKDFQNLTFEKKFNFDEKWKSKFIFYN